MPLTETEMLVVAQHQAHGQLRNSFEKGTLNQDWMNSAAEVFLRYYSQPQAFLEFIQTEAGAGRLSIEEAEASAQRALERETHRARIHSEIVQGAQLAWATFKEAELERLKSCIDAGILTEREAIEMIRKAWQR